MRNLKRGKTNLNDDMKNINQRIALLSENELLIEAGWREIMLHKLQFISGKSKDELADLISTILISDKKNNV